MKKLFFLLIVCNSFLSADPIERLINSGNIPLAEKRCQDLYETDPGLYYFYKGKLTRYGDSATVHYKSSLKEDPKGEKADSALYLLGEIFYIRGNYLTAVKYLKQALIFYPQSELRNKYVFLLGKSELALKDYESAEEYLLKLLKADDIERELLYYDLAQVCEGLGKYELGLEYYHKLLKKNGMFDSQLIMERVEDLSDRLKETSVKTVSSTAVRENGPDSSFHEKATTADLASDEKAQEKYYCQLGAFSNEKNARKLRDHLKESGYSIYIQKTVKEGTVFYHVIGGPYNTRTDAYQTGEKLKLVEGLDFYIFSH